MQLFSGTAATLLPPPPPPSPLELPLWVVVARTDLHDLFLRFATKVFKGADITNTTLDFGFPLAGLPPLTSGLCRMIYYGWLTEFVTCTTTSSTFKSAVGPTPVPPVGDAASFISLVQIVLAFRPGCRLYVLIGIYHFVIWFLSEITSSGHIDPSVINPTVINYIKQELAKHTYKDPDPAYHVALAPPAAYPADFADAFNPKNPLGQFEIRMRSILPHLEFKRSGLRLPDVSSFSSATDPVKYATRAALCNFIKEARRLLADTVHEEVLAVLEAIDFTLPADYKRTRVLALGSGLDTYGFFGERSFGILFFEYELAGAASNVNFGTSSDLVYLGIQKSATLEVLGRDASALFITHIGMDQNFNSEFSSITNPTALNAFIPHVLTDKFGISDRLISHETLYAVHNGTSRLESGGTVSIYNPSDSSFSLDGAECMQVHFSTNLESAPTTSPALSKQTEEIAFFIMSNNVPPVPAAAMASTSWLLPDNAFYEEGEMANLFQGNPSNLADLEAVLDQLVQSIDFLVSATLRGDGIGAILAVEEAPSSWENIAKASQQTDLPKFGTLSGENDQKRHARGTVSCFNNGDHHLLRIDAVGFASPVRCTWATRYAHPAKMKARIGDYVANYDTDTTGGPWYNGSLSSFRAFGLLKGMIEALKARVDARIPGSSPDTVVTLNGIKSQLDAFLATGAAVGIRTRSGAWVQRNGEDLFIDNALFMDVTTP